MDLPSPLSYMTSPIEPAPTSKISYRPFSSQDGAPLLTLLNHQALYGQRNLPRGVPDEGKLAATDIEVILEKWSSTSRRRRYAIFHQEVSELIGHCGCNWGWDPLCPRFDLMINPNWQRQGLGSEVASDLMDWLFNNGPAHNISCEVGEWNKPALAFLGSLGFQSGGTSRAVVYRDGQLVGYVLMDILRPEWDALGEI